MRQIPWAFTFYASEPPLQSPVLGWDLLRVIPSKDGAFYWGACKVRCQKTDLRQENTGEGWWRPYLVPISNHASHPASLRYNYYHTHFKYEVTKILSLLKNLSQKGAYASLHLCICPKLNSRASSQPSLIIWTWGHHWLSPILPYSRAGFKYKVNRKVHSY